MHLRSVFTLALHVTVVVAVSACDAPRLDPESDPPRRIPQLPSCDGDEDCREDESCVAERCHALCDSAADCDDTRPLCDDQLGVCVLCLDDGGCAADQRCDGGECFDVVVDGTCEPDSIGCSDEHTAFVCDHDGASKTAAPCRDDQRCVDGECHGLVCTPDDVVCAGNARVICDDTGTATTVVSCDDDCAEPLGCSCVEGACVERSCEPSSARCVGNSAQQCDALGLGFGDLVDCGADDCAGGRCLTSTCEPGATFCSGRNLLTCDDDGAGFIDTTCEEACTGPDGSAACTDRVCEPLSSSCVDGDTQRICNSDGTAAADVPCADGQACRDGVCQQTECVPACGARECGADPLCGLSCGDCGGANDTCTTDGRCEAVVAPSGPVLRVELSWTPASEDLDLYVSRDVDAGSMCTTDTCFFSTCKASAASRPDWDGTGTLSAGDPQLFVDDVAHDNPEAFEVTLGDGAAASFRVGADNFGTNTQNGTPAAAAATIRVTLDGAVVGTHSRSVAADAQWTGVVIAWNGSAAESDDDGSAVSAFSCTSPSGDACVTDADCPDGQGCISDFFDLQSSCQAVQCTRDDQCAAATPLCSGDHTCVAGPLKGWKEACASAAECHEGFHCDVFTQVCEEACSPQLCTSPNTAGCCVKTGGDVCTADALFGISGNCDP